MRCGAVVPVLDESRSVIAEATIAKARGCLLSARVAVGTLPPAFQDIPTRVLSVPVAEDDGLFRPFREDVARILSSDQNVSNVDRAFAMKSSRRQIFVCYRREDTQKPQVASTTGSRIPTALTEYF